MSILNSPTLNDEQRAWMKENYDTIIAKPSSTNGLSWFLCVTFTLVWVGLVVQLCISEIPLVVERIITFGVLWTLAIETISAIIGGIGVVAIFFINAVLEQDDDLKGQNEFISGLLSIEKPFSVCSIVSWSNNIMLVILFAINGLTVSACLMAILTFTVICYILTMKSIALGYYSELSSEEIDYLRGETNA